MGLKVWPYKTFNFLINRVRQYLKVEFCKNTILNIIKMIILIFSNPSFTKSWTFAFNRCCCEIHAFLGELFGVDNLHIYLLSVKKSKVTNMPVCCLIPNLQTEAGALKTKKETESGNCSFLRSLKNETAKRRDRS